MEIAVMFFVFGHHDAIRYHQYKTALS